MELARIHLRGLYAIVSGVTLLVIAPMYQSVALGSSYTAAIAPIANAGDFTPYLTWLSANVPADQITRILQIIAMFLALTLPTTLGAWLWPERQRARMAATISGWIGFGVFALAGFIGILASGQAAAAFNAATTTTAKAAIASTFAQNYALQSLLSRTLGGAALAVFLSIVSLRLIQVTRLPRWVAFLGGLTAASEAANAVVFLLNPLNVLSPTATLSVVGLALWLLVMGVALWQSRTPTAPARNARDSALAAPNTPTNR